MKRIYNYILLSVLAFAAAGCTEDEFDTNIPSAANGDEVQFGLSLSNPETRTIYGVEANNSFPIYWVNGDKVQIYSPDCSAGRNSAEYQVTVPEGSTQNYADKLTKTGSIGVQWGAYNSATFYSIYPSNNVVWDNSNGVVSATMNISSTQSLTHTLVGNTYYAADMNNVVMYAQTTANKGGNAVNLRYIPYSTIIEFELNASATGNNSLFVESLTLTAPDKDIAGNFNFTFGGTPSIATAGSNSKSVTLNFTTKPELNATNATLKAKMCLMPINDVSSLDGWSVSVTVRHAATNATETKTKTIKSTEEGTALKAGMVHKVKLPSLTAKEAWVYTPSAWMPKLPDYKTIYLTELSIPGAWYAGTKTADGYQATKDFSTLWANGVRAFGVECRSFTSRSDGSWGNLTNANPSRLCLSGTGTEKNGAYTNMLVSFDTELTYISDIISNIATQVNGTDEFAVLVLSYADGGEGGHRSLDYQYFLKGIQTEITNSAATNIVTQVNQNTTIGDVKGNLIIKVNVDNRTNYTCSGVSSLFSASPLIAGTNVTGGLVTSNVYYSDLVYGSWVGQDDTSDAEASYDYTSDPTITEKDFLWCFTSANRTQLNSGTVANLPTYAQRELMLNTMIERSNKIYEASTHNVWFYFNCGGTEASAASGGSTDGEAFANRMNPWLLNVIKSKMNGVVDENGNVISASDPSPLGIVMFNQCTGTATHPDTGESANGTDIIRAIIEMNNKFDLKHAPATKSAAVSYSSGMNDQGVSAFGWE